MAKFNPLTYFVERFGGNMRATLVEAMATANCRRETDGSVEVYGCTDHQAGHRDVVDEVFLPIWPVIHAEITIPSQQDALAAYLVPQQPRDLIVQSRRCSTRIAENHYRDLWREPCFNSASRHDIDPICRLGETLAI
jgi:hypothetical protein